MKHRCLKISGSWDYQESLDGGAQQDLRFWTDRLPSWNGKSILLPSADLVISSDASRTGWGGCVSGSRVSGHWDMWERSHHINWLELKAAFLAIQTFASSHSGIHILLLMDNRSAISFINHKGGTRSKVLSDLAVEMWEWCLVRHITVHAEHLPGSQNMEADIESRRVVDSSDWRLDRTVFLEIQSLWGPFSTDLFAARHNSQMPYYFSFHQDPGALALDALAQDWSSLQPYAFPPFSLIGRILQKLRQDRVWSLVLIAPTWHSQVWYPQLLDQLSDYPWILPSFPLLLQNQPHPIILSGSLVLAAWKVSGRQECSLRNFQDHVGFLEGDREVIQFLME